MTNGEGRLKILHIYVASLMDISLKDFIFWQFYLNNQPLNANSVWPDGWIIFPYLAIYINENLPNDIQNLPSVIQNLPNDIQNLPKLVQKNAKH